MSRTLGIIQARMGSTRLPGKVLLPLAGRSVLGWVVRAARASQAVDDLVVATTTDPSDDAVVAEAEAHSVHIVRGPTQDVLARFRQALDGTDADAVVRFTSDCPLLDPALVRATVGAWRAAPWLDYVSTAMPHSVPRGMDVEVVRADTLRTVDATATGHHRSHVTSAVYTQPDRYRMLGLRYSPDASDLRVTLDTEDDWRVIQAVVARFGDQPAAIDRIVPWLRGHREVTALNAHVQQKVLEAG
ncbi:MAG: glycosyltransferase family protein [Actinocatenispora sp.]